MFKLYLLCLQEGVRVFPFFSAVTKLSLPHSSPRTHRRKTEKERRKKPAGNIFFCPVYGLPRLAAVPYVAATTCSFRSRTFSRNRKSGTVSMYVNK